MGIGVYLGRHAGGGGGIGVYVRALVRHLLHAHAQGRLPADSLHLFGDSRMLDEQMSAFASEEAGNAVRFHILGDTLGRKVGLLADQLSVALLAKRHQLVLLHSLANIGIVRSPVQQIVSVHDLFQAWPPSPANGLNANQQFYRALFKAQFKRKDVFVCDLPIVVEEIRKRYRCPESQLRHIPLGIDSEIAGIAGIRNEEVRARLEADGIAQVPRRFVLCFASSNPRKNTRSALAAWRLYLEQQPEPVLPLWILCQDETIYRSLRADPPPHTYILESQPRLTLAALLRLAEVLLFPVQAEGFGLPVLEAAACGTKIVCPALEVCSLVSERDAFLSVCESSSIESISTAIAKAIRAPVPAAVKVRSMEDCANDTISIYRDLLVGNQEAEGE